MTAPEPTAKATPDPLAEVERRIEAHPGKWQKGDVDTGLRVALRIVREVRAARHDTEESPTPELTTSEASA